MRRKLLRFLGIFLFRQARWVAPVVIAVTVLAGMVVARSEFDTSMIDFLPPGSQLQARAMREIIRDYRTLEPIVVEVRHHEPGHEAELRAAASELADWLDERRYFMRPVWRVDELAQTYYQSLSDVRLVQLLTPEDWDHLEAALGAQISGDRLKRLRAHRNNSFVPPAWKRFEPEDPLGALDSIRERLAWSRGPTRLTPREGVFMSEDGRAIMLLLYPVGSPDDGATATRAWRFLQRVNEQLYERHRDWRDRITIEYHGSLVSTARYIDRLQGELELIVKLSIPLALILLLIAFRKFEAAIFTGLPPALALTWALGLTQWLLEGVSAPTFAFLLIMTAIGLQYAIHLYHRFTLELYRNHNYYRALRYAYVETGRGLLASALAVTGVYALLLVTALWGVQDWAEAVRIVRESRGFAQLGLVSAASILSNIAACLITLPLLAAAKHRLARGRVKPVALYRFGLERLYEPALANPRAALGVMLLVCVFFGWHARELNFHSRFASVAPFFLRTADSVEEQSDDREASFPRPGRPIVAVVRADTLQGALERNDRLYANLEAARERGDGAGIMAVDSMRTLLPSLKSQRESLAALERLDLEPLRREIARVSRASGFKSSIYEPFLDAIENFKEQAREPRFIEFTINESDELISNVQRYMTQREDGYYVATVVYPPAEGFDPAAIASLMAELREGIGEVSFIGDPVIELELSREVRFNLALLALLSLVVIAGSLMLHFRNVRMAWLTMATVVAELTCLGGMMALAGVQIHFFTLLAIPLMLSLAMDNALQLTQYYSDRRPCTVRETMLAVGRVSVLTCGVMALLLGTSSLATYPGLTEFGVTVLMGSLAVLGGTAMLLPALLQLLGRDQPLISALQVEGEPEPEDSPNPPSPRAPAS